jgi:D-glycero-D-manno-heptose 1,7-bisphosphate phosphatase
MTRPAVFLDRDGTLNEEAGYLDRLERLVFFPYTVDAVRMLNRAGYAVVVVTNQSGVARGIIRPAFVREAHDHIAAHLVAGGARIDGFYACPHHPQAVVESLRIECACRKPKPGMLIQAAQDLSLDLARSFVVGDRWHDLEAGHAAGARGVLVRTGHGLTEEQSQDPRVEPAAVADNLAAAVAWILTGNEPPAGDQEVRRP